MIPGISYPKSSYITFAEIIAKKPTLLTEEYYLMWILEHCDYSEMEIEE